MAQVMGGQTGGRVGPKGDPGLPGAPGTKGERGPQGKNKAHFHKVKIFKYIFLILV